MTIIKRIKNKLKSHQGFTLAELLMTTLIMMIATGMITQTLDLALKQFQKSTQISEAHTLCSALSTYVDGELTYATMDGSKLTGDKVVFDSDGHGLGAGSFFAIKTTSGSTPVGNNTTAVGKLVECPGADSTKEFNPVGNASYEISGLASQELFVGMSIRPGKKYDEHGDITSENDGHSIVIHLWVQDKNGNTLADRNMRVIPLAIN